MIISYLIAAFVCAAAFMGTVIWWASTHFDDRTEHAERDAHGRYPRQCPEWRKFRGLKGPSK